MGGYKKSGFFSRFIFIKYPVFSYLKLTPDIWSHVYGVFTVIGLIFAIVIFRDSYLSSQLPDNLLVIQSLAYSLCALLLCFIIASIYYWRRIRKLIELPIVNNYLETEVDRLFLVLKHLSECNHNIIAYYRNNYEMIGQFLQEKDTRSKDEIIEILNRFDLFLVNLTANLQNYYSIASGDNCSVTLKIINKDENLIKTYFRDPTSLKKRRTADSGYENPNGIYRISDNTAFEVILSDNYPNSFFAENDLMDLYNNHYYKNSNAEWYKYYNATLVVPISLVTGSNTRNVIGFIAIDNFKGDLANSANIEYLCSIGDLLYTLFARFNEFITFAHPIYPENDKIKRFTDWSYS